MLANIPNQWHNYLFHEGEIGLLHNDLPISVIFICGNISACHFLVIPRSEPTTGILIFKTILFTGIPAFKIMVFWRCGILMRCSWPFLVMKIKSSTPLVSYSPLSELLEASVKWSIGVHLHSFGVFIRIRWSVQQSQDWATFTVTTPSVQYSCVSNRFNQVN